MKKHNTFIKAIEVGDTDFVSNIKHDEIPRQIFVMRNNEQ